MMQKYPDRVPVVVHKAERCLLPTIDKSKFLVPTDLSFAQFGFVIRSRLKLRPSQCLFLFCGTRIPPGSSPMRIVYDSYRAADGFLYVVYTSEDAFGQQSPGS